MGIKLIPIFQQIFSGFLEIGKFGKICIAIFICQEKKRWLGTLLIYDVALYSKSCKQTWYLCSFLEFYIRNALPPQPGT